MSKAYITKSNYISGVQCLRKLWLDCNQKHECKELVPGSNIDIGNKIGEAARILFPAGILVSSKIKQEDAVEETKRLIADSSTTAIFEAAFTYNNTLVRVDILERINADEWKLIEVKSGKNIKNKSGKAIKSHYLQDVSFQCWVLKNAGLNISRAEIAHPCENYIKESDGIDYEKYICFDDVINEVSSVIDMIEPEVDRQFDVLSKNEAPIVRPAKGNCNKPYSCDYWSDCTANKPTDWVQKLDSIRAKKVLELATDGIESVQQLPTDYDYKSIQEIQANVLRENEPYVSDDLKDLLLTFGPAAYYLDFEFIRPSLPLFKGMKTSELVAFQWSCHFISSMDELKKLSFGEMLKIDSFGKNSFHKEFLAQNKEEPSYECAKQLLDVVGADELPILVYKIDAEKSAILSLAERVPEFREQLLSLLPRLKDLLPVVKNNICLPSFFNKPVSLSTGTYSIKTTAHAFCAEFDYANLSGTANGGDASIAYYRLVHGEFLKNETEASLRKELLEYCKYDTIAMIVVHQALIKLLNNRG